MTSAEKLRNPLILESSLESAVPTVIRTCSQLADMNEKWLKA